MNEHYQNTAIQSPPNLSPIDDRIARIDGSVQRLSEGLDNLESRLRAVCEQEINTPKANSPVASPACCGLDERLMEIEVRLLARLDHFNSIFRRLKL